MLSLFTPGSALSDTISVSSQPEDSICKCHFLNIPSLRGDNAEVTGKVWVLPCRGAAPAEDAVLRCGPRAGQSRPPRPRAA